MFQYLSAFGVALFGTSRKEKRKKWNQFQPSDKWFVLIEVQFQRAKLKLEEKSIHSITVTHKLCVSSFDSKNVWSSAGDCHYDIDDGKERKKYWHLE